MVNWDWVLLLGLPSNASGNDMRTQNDRWNRSASITPSLVNATAASVYVVLDFKWHALCVCVCGFWRHFGRAYYFNRLFAATWSVKDVTRTHIRTQVCVISICEWKAEAN